VIEGVTGHKKIERVLYKDLPLSMEQQETLEKVTEQLLKHKPIQYVLNHSWFCGMKLYVDENVLIPRPETEELVDWVIKETALSKLQNQMLVLDIGTGSGCIAIALKKKLKEINFFGIDISSAALAIAKRNANEEAVAINFLQMDFLNRSVWDNLPVFDIIVSNPPYVRKSESGMMTANVLQFEPHEALFVPDEDPLIFYAAIAEFAQTKLQTNGNIFVEINETLGPQVAELFNQSGFKNISLKKDMQGKNRLIKASA
jgi:release factor glutamine methyltransferase